MATIHVTTMEFVIGKPKGRAISTAFCDKLCSSGSEVPGAVSAGWAPAWLRAAP
jgi:hypothetical protein